MWVKGRENVVWRRIIIMILIRVEVIVKLFYVVRIGIF